MIKEDKRAATIREYYRRWTDARKDWETFAREDIDFYLGNHFSPEEADTLQERNQSSMPMDRLYSAIEQFKAIITSKPPKFSAVGREDSDNKMANVWKTLLEYIWDISDGDETFKQAVHDYAVTGLGYFYAYVDKEADYGRGEVKFTHVNPFRVAVDPNSRHRYFDDAAGISVSTILTKFQLLDLYPELSQPVEGKEKTLIELIETMDNDEDYPDSTNKYTAQSFTPDVVKDYDTSQQVDKYRLIEFYSKVKVPYYRVVNTQTGQTQVLTSEGLQSMLSQKEMVQAYEQGFVDFVEVKQTRIKLTAVLGQIILHERILDTDTYPIIPVPYMYSGTPYPMSAVVPLIGKQQEINKAHQIMLHNANLASNLRWMYEEGSAPEEEWEQ